MLISNGVEDTEEIGRKLGEQIIKFSPKCAVLALWGGMGMWKTAFTRGIACAFGIKDQVSSPTFAIVNEYRGTKGNIFHFDMYRVSGEDDLESTGFYEYLNKGLVIIEWSENIKNAIPPGAINVFIEAGKNENQRNITIEGITI